MHLLLRVVGDNKSESGEVTYTQRQHWELYWDTFIEAKTHHLPRIHPPPHRAGAPSTRKETEIGNKDHPLCLRTVNGSSNVFNLSPESNNGAHSTPPRYCSSVGLKALGFYHPALSQFLSLFPLRALFMKGLICGMRRWILVGWREKWTRKKKKGWMKRWRADKWACVWVEVLFQAKASSIWMTLAQSCFTYSHRMWIQFPSRDQVLEQLSFLFGTKQKSQNGHVNGIQVIVSDQSWILRSKVLKPTPDK